MRIERHHTNPFTILMLQLTPCFVLLFVQTRVFLINGWAVIPKKYSKCQTCVLFKCPSKCDSQPACWNEKLNITSQNNTDRYCAVENAGCDVYLGTTSLKSSSYFHFKPLLLDIVFQSKEICQSN